MLDEIIRLVEKLSDSKIAEKDEKGNIKTGEALKLEAVNDAIIDIATINGMLLDLSTKQVMTSGEESKDMRHVFDPVNKNDIKFQRDYANGLAKNFSKLQDAASDLYDTAVNIVNACECVRDSSSMLMEQYKDLERAKSTTKKIKANLYAAIDEIGK